MCLVSIVNLIRDCPEHAVAVSFDLLNPHPLECDEAAEVVLLLRNLLDTLYHCLLVPVTQVSNLLLKSVPRLTILLERVISLRLVRKLIKFGAPKALREFSDLRVLGVEQLARVYGDILVEFWGPTLVVDFYEILVQVCNVRL